MTDGTWIGGVRRPTGAAWVNGAISGVVAIGLTGLLLQFGYAPDVVSEAVPAVVGARGAAVGWVLLLAFGAVAGLVYAVVASTEELAGYAAEQRPGAVLGILYGLALWVVVAVVAVPLWLGAVGVPDAPAFPFVSLRALLAYTLFGLLVGLVYALRPYGR